MCRAIIVLFLSLGSASSAEATQCSPTDGTSTCHTSDQSVLLQSRLKRLKISGDTCNPCKVRGEQPKKKLQLDIFTPAASKANAGDASPVVLVFHGSGGTLKSVHNVCQKVVVPAGFVCATVDRLGEQYLEGAIRYLTEHADTYGVDPENFFAYGYSLGGVTLLKFMKMESDVGNKLKGVVSDCGATGKDKNMEFEKKDSDGNYLRFPAYLMLACDVDKKVKPEKNVDIAEEKLTEANSKRGEHEQIQWQSMRFSEATKCGHHQLVINSKQAAEAMQSFVQNVLSGANPFTNIPKKVTDKSVAKKLKNKKNKKK